MLFRGVWAQGPTHGMCAIAVLARGAASGGEGCAPESGTNISRPRNVNSRFATRGRIAAIRKRYLSGMRASAPDAAYRWPLDVDVWVVVGGDWGVGRIQLGDLQNKANDAPRKQRRRR